MAESVPETVDFASAVAILRSCVTLTMSEQDGHKALDALLARVKAAEKERDEARKIAGEWEDWLSEALDALGAKTVFDIKEAGQRREAAEERERGLREAVEHALICSVSGNCEIIRAALAQPTPDSPEPA